MSASTAPPPSSPPLASRGMWLIALLLGVGILSLATAALPGRAKPLFLLPLAFGVGSAGLSIALRKSLALPCTVLVWLLTAALALGGYGQVVVASYRQFQAAEIMNAESDRNAALALQMLEGTENRELADRIQSDVDARRASWDRYLVKRYAALGSPSPRLAGLALAAEAVLVILGVAIGRRWLDGRELTCQSAVEQA